MSKKNINILIFVAAAVVITLFMPTGNLFKYNFSLGKFWNNSPMVAQFDFPVAKTTEEYRSDREKYQDNYIPIYRVDENVTHNRLRGASNYFSLADTLRTGDRKRLGAVVLRALNSVYEKGIIDRGEFAPVRNNLIRVVRDNVVTTVGYDRLLTPDAALNEVTASIQKSGIPKSEYATIQISDFIFPNVVYDTELNDEVMRQETGKISKTKGFISKGSILINKGETIDETTLNKLDSYEKEYRKKGGAVRNLYTVSGNFLYVLILMILSYFSLKNFRADVMNKVNNVIFLVLLYLLSVLVTFFVTQKTSINIYAIPYVIIPFYIAAFYSSKMSVHQYVYLLLINALMSDEPFTFFVINFIAGVVGILIIKRSYRRTTILLAVGGTLLTYMVMYVLLNLIERGNFATIEPRMFLWFGINAVGILVLYQLLFLIEKLFNFVTRITLFELCDTNRKLLSDMAIAAPGSFQHSIQVSNIAQRAAKAIDANDLLAKTGALYHDIGKMINPMFFVENTAAGTNGAHLSLSAKESASIIRGHVTEGLALAKKNNLPQVVTDFITSHHGDSLIYFFYRKELDNATEAVDIEDFKYPGPRPHSKETAICMMADAIEAASRTLPEYTEESIDKLVESIIDTQIVTKQLSESPLTFHDLEIVKKSFKSTLMTIYHARIVYPQR